MVVDERMRVDSAGQQALATQLRDGVAGLGGVANAAPPAPNAGVSSGAVGQALSSILTAAAGLVSAVGDAGSKIDASDGSYGAVENQVTGQFGGGG